MTRRLQLVATLASVALLAGCAKPDTPRVEGPLAIEILELCTVCVEVLRCDGDGRQAAYVMDEKGAWAQVVTIWDYFADFFRPRTEDFRDVISYELGDDQRTVIARSDRQKARLDIWNRKVYLPDSILDQKTGAWLGSDGRVLGSCVHLSPTDGRALATALAGTKAP
ncbi:MAG: hypothetical protein KJ041_06730 [Gammaproteobacteria bacterium]|nr:hypothetical protein [Gammaproteobacteria bacterium]